MFLIFFCLKISFLLVLLIIIIKKIISKTIFAFTINFACKNFWNQKILGSRQEKMFKKLIFTKICHFY